LTGVYEIARQALRKTLRYSVKSGKSFSTISYLDWLFKNCTFEGLRSVARNHFRRFSERIRNELGLCDFFRILNTENFEIG